MNKVFLVVSAYINAYGWFVDSNGAKVAGPFQIGSNAFSPSVAYSPNVSNGQGGTGGFLVVYAVEGNAQANPLVARIVAYPGVLVTGEVTLSESNYSWIIAGSNAVAYSTTSQRFLVAWMSNTGSLPLMARVVGTNGQPIGSPIVLSSYVGLYPGVTWNPSTDRFGVSFIDEGSLGYAGFAVVTPGGSRESRQLFNAVAGQQGATDIDFNPDTGRFVMSWFQQPGSWEIRSAEIDNSANVLASGLLYSKAGDIGFSSLSIGFNPISRTFLGTTLETMPDKLDPVMGFELNRNGVRTSSVTQIGPGVLARNIRLSANTEAASWNVAFNHNTSKAVDLVVSTTSTGGGPSGTFDSPPPSSPTPSPTPSSCTSPQPASTWTCVNGNWLPPSDGGSTGGSTGGTSACPTTQPASDWVCVNGNWLPPSSGSTSGSTSGCTSPQPASDWVCVNGGWVPPSGGTSSGGSTSSCTSVKPASDWVCVNGDWLPPSLAPAGSGGSTSGCTSPQPASDWICVNGGWVPPSSSGTSSTSSCTTVKPASDWVCVNGDWVPPSLAPAGSTSGSTSSCTTTKPASDWVCVNGNWVPPTSGSAGGCTGSDPFAGIPGLSGICVNGDWKPVLSGG